jgi:hypothetical protein
MSTNIKIDMSKFMQRIYSILCKDCQRKLRALEVPVSQSSKVEELFKLEEAGK